MTDTSFFDDLGEEIGDVEAVRSSFITDPGTFKAKVSDIDDGEKDGNPQLIFKYEILEGPYAGSSVWDYFTYTRDRTDKDYDKKLGYIKARFEDLGLPKGHKGRIARDSFLDVEIVLTMVAASPKRGAKAGDTSHINPKTGKPYVNVGQVNLLGAEASVEAPATNVSGSTDTFFN